MTKVLAILIFFFALEACSEIESCDADPHTQDLVIRFLNDTSGAAKNVNYSFLVKGTNATVSFDSVLFIAEDDTLIDGVQISEGDTIKLPPEGNKISLPLNSAADSVTYYLISPDGSVPDTINLRYEREYSLYDPECLPSLIYLNIDTTSQTFDSLRLVTRFTTIEVNSNIEIFL